jgi:alpha-L-rhamnosidase
MTRPHKADTGVTSTLTTSENRPGGESAATRGDQAAAHRSFSELPAHLIGLRKPESRATPFLARQTFEVPLLPVSALLFSTSLGAHRAFVNGAAVDDGVLKPGWTAYEKRVIGEVADILPLLGEGTNVIVLEVAGGWYTENFGHLGNKGHWYGKQPSVAMILEMRFVDGRVERLNTDSSWVLSADGPVRSASLYDGEEYDARLADPRIHTPTFRSGSWSPAQETPAAVMCTPRTAPPVRITELVEPCNIRQLADGRFLVDFGQNVVGRVRISVSGQAGDEIVLRHAEVLERGELATEPLRAAQATDRYTLAGEEIESWAPEYTFHGFRYAEITGWPESEMRRSAVTAEVLGTDLTRTGWFSSSSALLNQFHENVVWSTRGNFLSIPSDCPQRDERLGWTGDIQVFTPTAATLFDVRTFLESWLDDLRLEQSERGGIVPVLVPDPLHDIVTPVAGWGDAATTVPWALYERYGNPEILRRSINSMRDWVAATRTRMEDGVWQGDFQFGDWLDPAAPPEDPGREMTSHDLVATAYAYRSASILSESARVLGERDVTLEAEAWAGQIRKSFLQAFSTPRGLLLSDSVSAYTLALAFGLAGDDSRLTSQWRERLVRLVRKAGYRIPTGFLATPLLCDALADAGHADVALKVLLQTEHPSWLAPVLKGATTVWERWDSLLEDGSVNPGQMTSFNHYALGAVVDFMHRRVAGLAPAAPGYAQIRFAPLPPTLLSDASSTLDTIHGRAAICWRVDGDVLRVAVDVPDGVGAEFVDPYTEQSQALGSGHHDLVVPIPMMSEPQIVLAGLNTSMSALIDDLEAYDTVLGALRRSSPEAARDYEKSNVWIPERTLGSTLVFLPAPVRESVAEALDRLSAKRTASPPYVSVLSEDRR